MHIISYRGPNAAGGVSTALSQIANYPNVGSWLYICDNELLKSNQSLTSSLLQMDEVLCDGHYRYCNNYLWPILHEMEQYAHYSEHEHQCYSAFNEAIAHRLSSFNCRERKKTSDVEGFFINDYQFALLPATLTRTADAFFFWHVPWPKTVAQKHIFALKEIASGLLKANLIGFHTDEYRHNFLNFISNYFPQCRLDKHGMEISFIDSGTEKLHQTRLLVAPLGLNTEYWNKLGKSGNLGAATQPPGNGEAFILSVDRADYTKGILERLKAIDIFFEKHAEWRERIYFRQIGTRSREGSPAFDLYWQDCHRLKDKINKRWGTSQWQPVVWSDEPVNSRQLAQIYRQATVMLVTPWRDGLNLTAKEYVASQIRSAGVLILSAGAGSWHELGRHCIPGNPQEPSALAAAIADSLSLPEAERYQRMRSLKENLMSNTLPQWWQLFYQACVNVRNTHRQKNELTTNLINKTKTKLRTNTA